MRFRSNLGHEAYSSRFALTWFLTFQDSSSELLYNRTEHQSLLTFLLPLTFAIATWSVASVPLGLLCALLAFAWWRAWPKTELIVLSVVQCSLCALGSDLNSGLSTLVLCTLGKHHTGQVTVWWKLTALCILHFCGITMMGESGQWGIPLPALVLLYCLERHKRDLWRRQELARSGQSQAFGLLEVQSTALALCDFQGHVLVHNSAAAVYIHAYAANLQLSLDLFGDLLRKCCEDAGAERRLEAASEANFSVRVHCQRVSWFSRNCALLTFTEVSATISAFSALSKVDTKVLNEVGTIERDVSRKFRDTNDPSTQLELYRLHMIAHEVNCSLAFQRAFSCHCEAAISVFHLRMELLDCVEFSSLIPETKALAVVLTFEPCVPNEVTGDKVATACMFTYAYHRVIEASNRASQVTIRVTIPYAVVDSMKVAVNFEFLTSDPQAIMRDFLSVATDVKESESFPTDDVGRGAFLAMLRTGKGDCLAEQMTFEGSVKRVHIRYEFYVKPENKSEGRFFQPTISHIRQNLSADKYKWDYLDCVEGVEPGTVRKHYIKRRSSERQYWLYSSGQTTLKFASLQPIQETNSSEQLDWPQIPQVGTYHTDVDYGNVVPEQLIRADSVPIFTQGSEKSQRLGEDIPMEVDQPDAGFVCRTLARNHCDLMRVSSSNTTSLGSSPSLHSS